MRNITVSIEDEIYQQARMIAAVRDTSISALVKEFLVALGSGGSEVERLKREERALRERISSFRASNRLSRDDLHECRTLYSEDMAHGREVEGVAIVNPFR